MPRYAAFLRAINVGGHVVKMEALRALFEGLGFTRVETFIASGNVIFETRRAHVRSLESRIEAALLEALGYEVATFVRTLREVSEVTQRLPFTASRVAAAGALNVGLLKEPLDESRRAALLKMKTDIDDIETLGAELYWLCQKKQSESKISNAAFERTLRMKTTFRGMRTLQRLALKYPA